MKNTHHMRKRRPQLRNLVVWAEDAELKYCRADRVLRDGSTAVFNFVVPVKPAAQPVKKTTS